MIDIHCHLIPNIDDGPRSWEESLEMAEMASQDGIEIAVSTPHWIQGTGWQPSPDRVKEKVRELNERIKDNGISLKVLPGMEIAISENLAELVSSGKVLMLGEGHCILIETPFVSLPYGIRDIIVNLKAMNIHPILAHPERSQEIQRNPKRIMELVKAGAHIQITAGSLCGCFGEQAKQCALELAKNGLVHAVASDAHSVKKRPPLLSKGLTLLEGFIGTEQIESLINNAYRFIETV